MIAAPAPRIRFHELPAEFRAIDAAIDELDGELTPELEARLDALEVTLEQRVDAMAALIREHDAAARSLAEEGDRLKARARTEENTAGRLRDYLYRTLLAMDRREVKADRATVRIQRNGQPSIKWTGKEEDLPPAYMKIRQTLDYAAALESYKSGGLPEGFDVRVGEHLRIV